VRNDTHTPFHIDLAWWASRGRSLRRFLAEILGENEVQPTSETIDYIDPDTAEVFAVDSLWARVLTEKAHRPDYITSATPLTNAVLRALIENLNRPMTPIELHRRINRTNPEAILRVMSTARVTYGIVPAAESADGAAKVGAARQRVAAKR
jgi:hypothetical protein